jgi:hypothetical protein
VAAETARVTVARTSGRDMGQREIFVSLDGREFAILRHGETATRDVAPGHHRIRAHNTLIWKTIEFELEAGDHIRFTAVNRAGWGTYSLMGWIGAGLIYLTFERDERAG